MASITPANTRITNAVLILGQRRRRWTNIKPVMGRSPMYLYSIAYYMASITRPYLKIYNYDAMLALCWTSVVSGLPTLSQHLIDVSFSFFMEVTLIRESSQPDQSTVR